MDGTIFDLSRGHEGCELKPYRDTAGKLTIASGRNLDDKGISQAEADLMLVNDIRDADVMMRRNFPWFAGLSFNRRAALTDAALDLEHRIFKFHDMLGAFERGDFAAAADALLDSDFARETGRRARRLAKMIRLDAWLDPADDATEEVVP